MIQQNSAFLAIAAVIAGVSPVFAAPLNVPPQQFEFELLGVTLALPVSAKIDVVTEGSERVATGVAVGNLGDLQAKAVPIAQAIPLPKEPCANPNGVNVVLDAIHSATITAEGDIARLGIVGTVTGYGCLMGVGAPVASTQVAMAAPLRVDVASSTDIGLVLAGPVEIVAVGLPADATALLSEQANAAIAQALADARTGQVPAIESVAGLEIHISDAAFFAEGDTLMIKMAGTSRMSEETFQALGTELGASLGSGI
jgi:hypothetical protein